jgi:hypothetical protein
MKHTTTQNSLTLIALSLLLSACSGGGGSGSNNLATQDTTSTVLALTSDNYIDYTVLFNKSLYDEVTAIRNAYHQPNNDTNRLLQLLWLKPSAAQLVNAQLLANLPTVAGNYTCSQGGTVTRTLNDTNADGIVSGVGEYQDISLANCNNGSIIANGSMRYTINTTNNPSVANASMMSAQLSYNNLTVNQSGRIYTTNGSKAVSVDTTNGLTLNSQPTVALMNKTQTATSTTTSTQSTSYQISYIENGTDWQASLTGGMTFLVGNQQANLTFATTTPLTGSMTSSSYNPPRTGRYTTTWNNQNLLISSNADGLITTQADLDANGSYELSYSRNWDTLTIPTN